MNCCPLDLQTAPLRLHLGSRIDGTNVMGALNVLIAVAYGHRASIGPCPRALPEVWPYVHCDSLSATSSYSAGGGQAEVPAQPAMGQGVLQPGILPMPPDEGP